MSMHRDHVPSMDEEITAYLDGELATDAVAAFESRLAGDAELRNRLDFLRAGRPPAAPFDLLLDMAPGEKLRAMLAATEVRSEPRRRWMGGFGALAAAIVLLAVGAAIGFGAARFTAPVEVAELPGWRSVVAGYVALYTTDTFAMMPSDPVVQAPRLKQVGDSLGLDLDPQSLTLAGLDLKGGILFQYDGKPLAQIAYLSPKDGPVAFCIIANGKPDAPVAFEERNGRNIVFWNAGGRGYLIIGKVPREQLQAYAETLKSQVS